MQTLPKRCPLTAPGVWRQWPHTANSQILMTNKQFLVCPASWAAQIIPPPHLHACYSNTLKHMRAPTANDSGVYAWCQAYNCSVIEFIPLQGEKKQTNKQPNNKSAMPLPLVASSLLSEVIGERGGRALKGTAMLMLADMLVLRVCMLAGRKLCHVCCFSPQGPGEGLDGCVARDSQGFRDLQISAWVLQISRKKKKILFTLTSQGGWVARISSPFIVPSDGPDINCKWLIGWNEWMIEIKCELSRVFILSSYFH